MCVCAGRKKNQSHESIEMNYIIIMLLKEVYINIKIDIRRHVVGKMFPFAPRIYICINDAPLDIEMNLYMYLYIF